MRSTMMDVPLTVTRIMQYGSSVFGDREVVTYAPDGAAARPTRETGAQVAKLANALRSLGVDGDQRVATLMWNNAEHLEAYLAIPSMGAVLHTLNLRLEPADHRLHRHPRRRRRGDRRPEPGSAADPGAAARRIDPPRDRDRPIRRYRCRGAGRPRWRMAVRCTPTTTCSPSQPDSFDWPDVDERSAAAMCYTSGTTGHPKGVVYSHRSMHLHSMAVSTGARCSGSSEPDRVLPVVPMFHANAWGLPYAAVMAGASLIMPDRFLQPEHAGQVHRGGAAHGRRRGADDLERAAAARPRATAATSARCGSSRAAARPSRTR